jgi:hypothetical protein
LLSAERPESKKYSRFEKLHIAQYMMLTKNLFNLLKRKLFLGRPLTGPGKIFISLRPLCLERQRAVKFI